MLHQKMAGRNLLRSAAAFTVVARGLSFATTTENEKEHVAGWLARWDGRVTKGVSSLILVVLLLPNGDVLSSNT
jgi:hypothetical protein